MDLYDQLRRDEGFRQFPYKDTAGKLTIGYGWNLDSDGVDKEIAEIAMRNKVAVIAASLRSALMFFDRLSLARQAVLINIAYNNGIKGLLDFKRMIIRLQINSFERAAAEIRDSDDYRNPLLKDRYERLAKQMETDTFI